MGMTNCSPSLFTYHLFPGLAIYFSPEHALEEEYADCSEENGSNQGTCPPTVPPQQPLASLRVR